MYTYILPVSHVSARLCTCACMYARMTYERIRMCILGFMCYACIGPAMRAMRAYIHTYNVAAHCATVGTTPSLLVRDDTVRTKLLALQTDSSAQGTPCTMCTPSNSIHVPLLHSLGTAITTSCSFAFGTIHPCSLKYIHTLHSYDYVHGMYKPSLLSEMQFSRAQDS